MNDSLFQGFRDEVKTKRGGRMSDRLHDTFAASFESYFGVPYRNYVGDFVQLARLLEAAPDFEEEYWLQATRHYLTSPMGKYSIADLASRVEVFHKGRLDKFNKPFNSLVEGNEAALTDWMNRKDTE